MGRHRAGGLTDDTVQPRQQFFGIHVLALVDQRVIALRPVELPDVNGQPDPNPNNWFPRNGFLTDISFLAGRNLRHIRFMVTLDVGRVTGLPLPSQIVVSQIAIRY